MFHKALIPSDEEDKPAFAKKLIAHKVSLLEYSRKLYEPEFKQ